jgi:hypothetical protein
VLKNHREEDSWDSDPVHPKPKIYEEMAKLSVTLCEQAGEVNSKKRPRIDSEGSGGPTARAGAAPELHGRSDGPYERPPGNRTSHSGRRGGGNSGGGLRGFSFGAVDVRTLDATPAAAYSDSRRSRLGGSGRSPGGAASGRGGGRGGSRGGHTGHTGGNARGSGRGGGTGGGCGNKRGGGYSRY